MMECKGGKNFHLAGTGTEKRRFFLKTKASRGDFFKDRKQGKQQKRKMRPVFGYTCSMGDAD